MHPRASLATWIESQATRKGVIRGNRVLREVYRENGWADYFSSAPISSDPLEVLASFVAHFTTDGAGRPNGFIEPLEIIPKFLDEWAYVYDKNAVFQALAVEYKNQRATYASILNAFQSTAFKAI